LGSTGMINNKESVSARGENTTAGEVRLDRLASGQGRERKWGKPRRTQNREDVRRIKENEKGTEREDRKNEKKERKNRRTRGPPADAKTQLVSGNGRTIIDANTFPGHRSGSTVAPAPATA
jgi:hypothetical protein